MRLKWFTTAALALGLGIIGSTAHAASNADYLATRNKTAITTISETSNLAAEFASRPGQVVELQGLITGVFSGGSHTGYLLRVDNTQTIIVSMEQPDNDLNVGSNVRVLARIPSQGVTLEGISATRGGSMLAQSDLANLRSKNDIATGTPRSGIDIVTNEQTQRVRYYRAPEFTADPAEPVAPPRVTPQTEVMADLPLAQQPLMVQRYAQRIQTVNSDIDSGVSEKIAYHLLDKSEKYGVDPRLVFALVTQESKFDPRAVSYVGAQGLGQLMPGTAASLGVHNAFDIEDNLDGTVRYLSDQLNKFGRLSLALAAYNAGPGNVQKYGGVPPFRETQNYVKVIWNHYAELSGRDPVTGQTVAAR